MKLLSKRQTDIESNILKRNQIDEGVRIAKKVDVLRETLADLEGQRALFISNSKRELEKETEKLYKELEVLQAKIKKAQERRNVLLKPLNEEWEDVKSLKIELKQNKDFISDKIYQLNERESQIEKTEKAIEKTRNELSQLKSDAEKERRDAEKNRVKSEDILKKAENRRDSDDREHERRNKELTKITARNEFDRQANKQVEKSLLLKEKELNNREKQINDKYQTLLRTINRLKK